MTIHTVQRGDTLTGIAQRYGTSVQRILTDNGLTPEQRLVTGQALLILIPSETYTVLPDDTLYTIASRYGISVITLVQNNPDLANAPLYPGQTLTIRFDNDRIRGLYINGYAYPYIRMPVLRRALPSMTYLTIFGYGFTEDGTLIPIDDQPLINAAYTFNTAPVMLLSSMTENDNFSTERASLLFRDIELQNKVLDNIISVMLEKGYVGLDSDFEYIDPQDVAAYVAFLENAAARLHVYGFFLNTDLAPKTSATQEGLLYEAHDYGRIGAIADTVLLMTYEWGYTYGPPMAIAPINRVREVVSYAVTEIPPQKIMMGVPTYGYDWPLPFVQGVTQATVLGAQEAVALAARYNASIQFDQTAQSPYFNYRDSNGQAHVVWFEDVRSIRQKFNLIDEFSLRGAGYWNIMRPFAQNWSYISAAYTINRTTQ